MCQRVRAQGAVWWRAHLCLSPQLSLPSSSSLWCQSFSGSREVPQEFSPLRATVLEQVTELGPGSQPSGRPRRCDSSEGGLAPCQCTSPQCGVPGPSPLVLDKFVKGNCSRRMLSEAHCRMYSQYFTGNRKLFP